jgi:hypothetical protein
MTYAISVTLHRAKERPEKGRITCAAEPKATHKVDRVLIAHTNDAPKCQSVVMRRMLAMDERFDELRRELDQKTTEIESLVAEPRRYREYGPF